MAFVVFICIVGFLVWIIMKKLSFKKDNISSHSPIHTNITLHECSVATTGNVQNTSIQTLPANKRENGQWIIQNNPVNINGYQISGGFIYVGTELKAVNGYQTECALINPSLKIDPNNDDYRVRRLNYWPSYSAASPDARAAYLKWLSAGKIDPDADIGYIFLYFYGLERRLLYDTVRQSVSNSEIQALVTEVTRLLNIYGDNDSFNAYASSLLNYVQAEQYCATTQIKEKVPNPTKHFGLPISLLICLGQMARDNTSLPAEWALAWYFSTPNPPVYARTPARRCWQEFVALFAEEYSQTFGQGIKLKDNKTRLKIRHRPASNSLSSENYLKTLNIPDVSRQTSVINKIASLVQICQDRLDSYSRYLGRNPENKDTFDALLELPVSIWPDNVKNDLNSLQSMLMNKKELTLNFSTLLNHFPQWQDKSKKRFLLFMERLESFHIGFEPDFRTTGIKPDMDTPIILFYLEGAPTNDISPAYSLMALAMHLGTMVSEADEEVSPAEIDALKHQIDCSTSLTLPEKRRLNIYLKWLISQPLSIKGIKKKIESLETRERELIGDLLINISQADGTISAIEIKLMEKVFRLLDIDSNVLYSKIHSYYAEPVIVKEATNSNSGFSIPVPTSEQYPQEKTFSLDMNKVASLNKETENVASFLSAIFNQEESEQKNEKAEIEESQSGEHDKWRGLTPSIYEIVFILSKKTTWYRRELEELAYNKNLMLEGMLEQINETAFDCFDEPFIEGEDPVEINQEIVMVMNQ